MQFEPFVCDHAAFLTGRRPWEVSRDRNLLFEAQKTAIQRYRLKLCVVGIDIYNAEAEALGCVVEKPEGDNSPAIFHPLYSSINAIHDLQFDPEKDGRLPMIMAAAVRLKEQFPDCDVRVPLCGPFSLAGHLLGIENLLYEAADETELAKEKLLYLAEILIRYVRAIYSRNLKATIFESTAAPPLLSLPLFQALAAPALRRMFEKSFPFIGENPALIMGGNTLPILDSILALKPQYIICPFETNQEEFVRKSRNVKNTRIRINMNPAVFLDDTPEKALAEAKRVSAMASGLENSSVGLLLPFAAAPNVVVAVSEFVAAQPKAD